MLIVVVLRKLADLLSIYCRSRPLTEHAIRNNFLAVYELLDGNFALAHIIAKGDGWLRSGVVVLPEVLDFGVPQILELDVLKNYITCAKGGKLEKIVRLYMCSTLSATYNRFFSVFVVKSPLQLRQLTVQATGATSWRAEGIKYVSCFECSASRHRSSLYA